MRRSVLQGLKKGIATILNVCLLFQALNFSVFIGGMAVVPDVASADVVSLVPNGTTQLGYSATPSSLTNTLSDYTTTTFTGGQYTAVATADGTSSSVSAASSDGAPYVDDVFSTYTYMGNGSSQTINNGIDLAGNGGLVWIKSRTNAYYHGLYDTVRGVGTGKSLYTNTTEAQGTNSTNQNLTAFNSNGFSLGTTSSTNVLNATGDSFISWTFRKAPKFFDVVTYAGDGSAGTRSITHNLGTTP